MQSTVRQRYRIAYGARPSHGAILTAELEGSEGGFDDVLAPIQRVTLTSSGASAITTTGRRVQRVADSLAAMLKRAALDAPHGGLVLRGANADDITLAPGWRAKERRGDYLSVTAEAGAPASARHAGVRTEREAWLIHRAGRWHLDSMVTAVAGPASSQGLYSRSVFRSWDLHGRQTDEAQQLVREELSSMSLESDRSWADPSQPDLEPPPPLELGGSPPCLNPSLGAVFSLDSTSLEPDVVLQHGFLSTADTWCRALPNIMSNVHHGSIQVWTTGFNASISSQANLLRNKLDQNTPASRVRVGLGHSMGGLILRQASHDSASRVSGFITIDTPNAGADPAVAIGNGFTNAYLQTTVVPFLQAQWCSTGNWICQLSLAALGGAVGVAETQLLASWPSAVDLHPNSPFFASLLDQAEPPVGASGYVKRGYVANRIPHHFALPRLAEEMIVPGLSTGASAQFGAYVGVVTSILYAAFCNASVDPFCAENALAVAGFSLGVDAYWVMVSGNYRTHPAGSDGFISFASQRDLFEPGGTVRARGYECDARTRIDWWACPSHLRNTYWAHDNSPQRALDVGVDLALMRRR
jgi:pimeloyl-ACP methyl ester carboxylesterase